MTSQNERFYLESEDGILKLCKQGSKEKIFTDFLHQVFQHRLKTLSKKQPLLKALQIRENMKILDATAGLGKDALGMAFMGAQVLAIEENDFVFALLEDGLKRAFLNPKFLNKFQHLRIQKGSSFDYLKNISDEEKPDAIYLDPMYPVTEKSAKSKKEMTFLKELLKPTQNLEELLKLSIEKSKERVVLKRPLDSEFLLKKPQASFESKLVRFDMYLSRSRV